MYKRTLLLNWNIIGTCQQLWLRLIEQLLDVGHLTLLHNCGHALSTTHYLFTQLFTNLLATTKMLHLYYWFSTTEAYLCNGYFGTLEGYVTNQVDKNSFLLTWLCKALVLLSMQCLFSDDTVLFWGSFSCLIIEENEI